MFLWELCRYWIGRSDWWLEQTDWTILYTQLVEPTDGNQRLCLFTLVRKKSQKENGEKVFKKGGALKCHRWCTFTFVVADITRARFPPLQREGKYFFLWPIFPHFPGPVFFSHHWSNCRMTVHLGFRAVTRSINQNWCGRVLLSFSLLSSSPKAWIFFPQDFYLWTNPNHTRSPR